MPRAPSQIASPVLLLIGGNALGRSRSALPQSAAATHWPWWLRMIAVIGALALVQIVARSLRKGAGARGTAAAQDD